MNQKYVPVENEIGRSKYIYYDDRRRYTFPLYFMKAFYAFLLFSVWFLVGPNNQKR